MEEEEKQDEEAQTGRGRSKERRTWQRAGIKGKGRVKQPMAHSQIRLLKVLLRLSPLETLCKARFLVTGANGRFLQRSLSPET